MHYEIGSKKKNLRLKKKKLRSSGTMQSIARSPCRLLNSFCVLPRVSRHGITTSTYTSRTRRTDYRPKPAAILPPKKLIPERKRESYETNPTPVVEPFMTDKGEIEYRIVKEYYTQDDIDNEIATYSDDLYNEDNNENGESLSDVLEMATKNKPKHTAKRSLTTVLTKEEIKKAPKVGIPEHKKEAFEKLQSEANEDDVNHPSNNIANRNNNKKITAFDERVNGVYKEVWPYKKWLWRSEKNLGTREFDHKLGLNAFIDDENTRVGRAWYTTELRLKVCIFFCCCCVLVFCVYFLNLEFSGNF